MILIFAFSFGLGHIMLLTGFLRSAAYHSGLDRGEIARIRLRRHWRKTLLLFAIAIYAGLHL